MSFGDLRIFSLSTGEKGKKKRFSLRRTAKRTAPQTAMGKRTTIAYSSEDVKRRKKDDDGDNTNDAKNATLKTYYCQCCSNHVLITDCNLFALPRRRVDASIILDATKYVCRLRAKRENVATVIRRKDGEILEKQTRYYCGKVPVCYECNDEKGKVYVLDGALRSFEKGSKKDAQLPVPPCIRTGKGGKVIFPVRVIEGQEKRAVIDIGAENVSVSLQTRKTDDPKGVERELLEFLSETIKCRVAQLSVLVNDEEDEGRRATKDVECEAGAKLTPEKVFRALLENSREAARSA